MVLDTGPVFEAIKTWLADYGTLVSIFVAAAIGASIWVNVRLSNKSLKQTERHVQENNHRDDKYRSALILSDMLRTTKEFRYGIDCLWEDKELDEKARNDLIRVMTYLGVLALYRQDKLISDDHLEVVYKGLLKKLTDEKIVEILQDEIPEMRVEHLQNPEAKLYRDLRAMRDELV